MKFFVKSFLFLKGFEGSLNIFCPFHLTGRYENLAQIWFYQFHELFSFKLILLTIVFGIEVIELFLECFFYLGNQILEPYFNFVCYINFFAKLNLFIIFADKFGYLVLYLILITFIYLIKLQWVHTLK
jgi:hypothetical protein